MHSIAMQPKHGSTCLPTPEDTFCVDFSSESAPASFSVRWEPRSLFQEVPLSTKTHDLLIFLSNVLTFFFFFPQPRCLEGVDNQPRAAGNSGQDSPNVSICPGCYLSRPLTEDADHGPGNADVGGWKFQGTTWYLHLKSSHLSGINVLDPSFKHTTTAYTSTTAAGGHLCCCPP